MSSTHAASKAALILGALALPTLVGCASRDLNRGMSAYEVGNYHKAAEQCERVDSTSLDERKQVRYFVYCGLSYYELGDTDSARDLLTRGQKLYVGGEAPAADRATWLKPIIVDRMNKALERLSGASFSPAAYFPRDDEPQPTFGRN